MFIGNFGNTVPFCKGWQGGEGNDEGSKTEATHDNIFQRSEGDLISLTLKGMGQFTRFDCFEGESPLPFVEKSANRCYLEFMLGTGANGCDLRRTDFCL
ncbi:hypothetical protein SAMN06265373_101318 [Shimia sagamensis]|uniref:Uncharacterized protein n=1 Tax=Shimia sagamensis TaxID=1566352 RepID=A0ABY1N7U7_9RHOB|nr:hypothetical protein SAMN06265373_101318 [Shimia sagamensis]